MDQIQKIKQKLIKLPFDSLTLEESHRGLKATLTFNNNTLIIRSNLDSNYKNIKYSFFINKRHISSDKLDLDKLITNFNLYLESLKLQSCPE